MYQSDNFIFQSHTEITSLHRHCWQCAVKHFGELELLVLSKWKQLSCVVFGCFHDSGCCSMAEQLLQGLQWRLDWFILPIWSICGFPLSIRDMINEGWALREQFEWFEQLRVWEARHCEKNMLSVSFRSLWDVVYHGLYKQKGLRNWYWTHGCVGLGSALPRSSSCLWLSFEALLEGRMQAQVAALW